MSEFSHTVTIRVPAWAWDAAAKGLRALRENHRSMGGTSRMVRNGEAVTFTASGPAAAVLAVTESVTRVERVVADQREKARERLYEGAQREQQEWRDRLMDGLIERGLVR